MANIREYNMNGTLILGIDHGYGNIKTAHRVFPTALIKSEKAPTFSKDYLEYDGYFYIIGEVLSIFAIWLILTPCFFSSAESSDNK